jgi:hypothetical protein
MAYRNSWLPTKNEATEKQVINDVRRVARLAYCHERSGTVELWVLLVLSFNPKLLESLNLTSL